MENLNLFGCSMSREVMVHVRFVLLHTHFYLKTEDETTIADCLIAIRQMDETLNELLQGHECIVFDVKGNRLSSDLCLKEFGECYWIELLAA